MSVAASPYVSIGPGGKLVVELLRAFKVRRYHPDPDITTLTEDIVWAHSYCPDETGALIFTSYKAKTVQAVDEKGEASMQEMALQTFSAVLAPGTWYDITEAPILAPKPNTLTH